MDKKRLAFYLDLANHHQDATPAEIKKLCQEVKKYGFHSAFVNPCYVSLAKKQLGEKITVGTVVAFPLGQELTDLKVLASLEAVRKGADELDISMNVGFFKAGKLELVQKEMKTIVEAVNSLKPQVRIKFIIETGWLEDTEIKKASQIVFESGADFIKTCSGMGPRGARLKDVKLIREAIGDKIKIKVAGGVDTYQEAIDFIKVGANRIGTSKAVKIVS